MSSFNLFPQDKTIGIFRGFSEGGIEFHADLVLPYKAHYQRIPMHGQFLLVQLENELEAVVGRISSISSEGRLTSSAGEEYNIRAVNTGRKISEDLRDDYLRYKIDMRVLGVVKIKGQNRDQLIFAPTHRRLPHVGSRVAFPSNDVLQELALHNDPGAELGFLSFGEFVYADNDKRVGEEEWMQILDPKIVVKFEVQSLVSRRSFVFARAGFGKSNLVKLLFSNLYKNNPVVEKRGGKMVPVGTIIFDPDGEYFWPDDKNRPGLCDVAELEEKIVVFTPRKGPSPFYQSFVAGDIKLDIRRLRPSDVISIALSPDKQDQQNVRKLKGLSDANWRELVDLIHDDGNSTDPVRISALLNLKDQQEAELFAARANMTTIVRMLHDPSSQMLDMLFAALEDGKICIVDVSRMRGTPALILSGLILSKIFEHNQEEFTKSNPRTIPTIAVVEEAQSILSNSGSSGGGPFISWVKEGRKYDLGSLMITQQPGSIPGEILSQGDNWFIFHLLAANDLNAVRSANAHFSQDILRSLLNEPIPGHGVFWSSVNRKSYPISVRVMLFQQQYKPLDPGYNLPAAKTAAEIYRKRFSEVLAQVPSMATSPTSPDPGKEVSATPPRDVLKDFSSVAILKLKENDRLMTKVRQEGAPWMAFIQQIREYLPSTMHDAEDEAAKLVPKSLNEIFGPNGWKTERRPTKAGNRLTTYVVIA